MLKYVSLMAPQATKAVEEVFATKASVEGAVEKKLRCND